MLRGSLPKLPWDVCIPQSFHTALTLNKSTCAVRKTLRKRFSCSSSAFTRVFKCFDLRHKFLILWVSSTIFWERCDVYLSINYLLLLLVALGLEPRAFALSMYISSPFYLIFRHGLVKSLSCPALCCLFYEDLFANQDLTPPNRYDIQIHTVYRRKAQKSLSQLHKETQTDLFKYVSKQTGGSQAILKNSGAGDGIWGLGVLGKHSTAERQPQLLS